MRWKIVFFTIFTAAILCNYIVYSTDENEVADDVEQVPVNLNYNHNDQSAASDVKNDNEDEDYDHGEDEDKQVEQVIEEVKLIPAALGGSIMVAPNSSAMQKGEYRMGPWDEYYSPLDQNEFNYDWNGK